MFVTLRILKFNQVRRSSMINKQINKQTVESLSDAYMFETISDTTEHLWYICCGTLICEGMDETLRRVGLWVNRPDGGLICLLLAVFTFDTKHHALSAHLARLRQPRLCGKTVEGREAVRTHEG